MPPQRLDRLIWPHTANDLFGADTDRDGDWQGYQSTNHAEQVAR